MSVELVDTAIVVLAICTALVLGLVLLATLAELVWRLIARRASRRQAREEAALDLQSAAMRSTILSLAEQLGGSAHEARKALIRESFLASGHIQRD